MGDYEACITLGHTVLCAFLITISVTLLPFSARNHSKIRDNINVLKLQLDKRVLTVNLAWTMRMLHKRVRQSSSTINKRVIECAISTQQPLETSSPSKPSTSWSSPPSFCSLHASFVWSALLRRSGATRRAQRAYFLALAPLTTVAEKLDGTITVPRLTSATGKLTVWLPLSSTNSSPAVRLPARAPAAANLILAINKG